MVDVFPLKNFPRKQTLIGNGGNSGGGGGRYKKREAQITFHRNFKYGKINGGNWLLLLTITVDISIKGFIFKRINNENGTMIAQLFSLKAIPKSFTASHCHIITALSWPRQVHHKHPAGFYKTDHKSTRGPYLIFTGRFDTKRIKLIGSRCK